LFVYHAAEGRQLVESELGGALSFSLPDQRLLSGQVDPFRAFALRQAALDHQFHRRKSPVRGVVGGRMDLIPHQLYIASEVTRREAPRVLLADEVGLGKTVEACLIIHRLLATGRVARVLIVVPESLVHQWFVELLRRFNLWFHIFNEERCAAVEAGNPDANPFLEDQLVLCPLSLLLREKRALQAVDAGWDMLVVDEAHHLRWRPGEPSPEYRVVEALSRNAEGLLLLTATPEQLGLTGHFARLRLLDPDRYPDLERFEHEVHGYGEVAAIANRLLEGASLNATDQQKLHRILGEEPGETRAHLESLAQGDPAARQQVLSELLDRHGTGRVMFRNTRAAIKGFPRRIARPAPLDAPADHPEVLVALAAEFESDLRPVPVPGAGSSPSPEPLAFTADPRLAWLERLLTRLKGAKVLLICRTAAKVLGLEAALRSRMPVRVALFHEGLELIQRDRNAAWFAEEEGAQILLASEIGSEGRNFQFAHHLVLFDLPLDPELVEQRIGRLDRIGQTSDIQIHTPFVRGSSQEVLFRWFNDGLDAFRRNLVAGRELLERFADEVRDLAQDYHETQASRRDELEDLVTRTRAARLELEERLEMGRDRLLELNSYRPAVAEHHVAAISRLDQETALEEFLLQVWDHHGVPVEDLAPRTYRVGGDGVYAESFPALPPGGLTATLDRRMALAREDLAFLTWDHPMVTGALDLMLGSQNGNSAFVICPAAPDDALWLETVYLLECVAPPRLHADRFLPATPIRLWVDARRKDVTDLAGPLLARAGLEDGPVHEVLHQPAVRALLPLLVSASQPMAQAKTEPLINAAIASMELRLGHELERLRALATVNPAVRPQEIAALQTQQSELRTHLAGARLRLDSVRLIISARLWERMRSA
jgi:ATP-dependent helicase HepA